MNLGCCGVTSTGYLQRYRENRYDFSDADIILVMLGTNGGLWGEFKQHYIELVKALENDYGAEVMPEALKLLAAMGRHLISLMK